MDKDLELQQTKEMEAWQQWRQNTKDDCKRKQWIKEEEKTKECISKLKADFINKEVDDTTTNKDKNMWSSVKKLYKYTIAQLFAKF